MKKRRILTALLAAVMLLSAVPFGAMAKGTETTPAEEGKLFLDKTATLENDGSYTINMEAYATGTTTVTPPSAIPLDIVLVLDQSGSMADELNGTKKITSLQKSVREFIHKVEQNGQDAKVQHRVAVVGFASGSHDDTPYSGTGVYDADGIFQKRKTSKNLDYVRVDASALEQSQTYYVKVNSEFVPLTYSGSADKYVAVAEPVDTTRTDLYGDVSGYQPAKYGTLSHEELVPAAGPKKDDGKTYYDANGNQLTWVEETKPDYVKVTSGDFNGTEYYIEINNNTDPSIAKWIKLTYNSNNWDGHWDESPNVKNWNFKKVSNYQFRAIATPNKFDAYTMTSVSTGNWFLSADGKTSVTDVYVKETKTEECWIVNGAKYNGTLYEKQVGQGGWQYKNGNQTVTLTNEKVYKQAMLGGITAETYKGALVNVGTPVEPTVSPDNKTTTYEIGTTSLKNAVDNLTSEGATRVSIGIKMANEIFNQNPLTAQDKKDGRQRIMIVFTDGVPGRNSSHPEIKKTETALAVNQAYETKNTYGASVYTIGFYPTTDNTEQTDFLSHLSSEYPNAKYQFKALTKLPNTDSSKTYCYHDVNGDYGTAGEYMGMYKKDSSWYVYYDGKKAKIKKADNVYEAISEFGSNVIDPETGKAKKYSFEVDNDAALSEVFKKISGDISASTSVTLDATAIMRDTMAQGFELTADSKIKVSVVPGAKADANANIVWKDNEAVQAVNGQQITVNAKPMTIQTSTTANKQVDVTGFSYKDQYITEGHAGAKLVVEITGVKALPTVTTDQNIYTNHEQSGIWEKNGQEPVQAFPKPQTHMTSKAYVVDYAKPLELPIKDVKLNTAKDIDIDGYDPFDIAKPNTAITHTYGDVKLEGGKLTYTPKTMKWDGYDTFYVFGTTADATVKAASANANGNVWAKVNVIPANNVYYEDTFESGKEVDGTALVGITYTGNWITDPNAPGTTTKPEDGSNANDNHGWIPALDGEKGDTDGSSHHATFDKDNMAKATFTFTGTGVDIYSRTNNQTGTIMAKVTDQEGNTVRRLRVDTVSASGQYYQVPTLSIHKNSSGVALPHGTYTVEITVTSAAKGRYEYYLDGIRVYNPAQDMDGFYADDEKNAQFIEVRDKLLDQSNTPADGKLANDSVVFIDQLNDADGVPSASGVTHEVGVYKDLGPKNEVYLAKGQSIAFKVDNTKGNNFQIGLKALDGSAVQAALTKDGHSSVTVNHTADMYYDVTAGTDGIIIITNDKTSAGILSITKLKVTNANTPVDTAAVFAEADVPTLLSAVQTFNAAPVEPEVPTEPETQPTEPETQPSEPDVDIENPTEPEPQPEKPSKPSIKDILDKIFGGIHGWH